jgi:hypothetical protein
VYGITTGVELLSLTKCIALFVLQEGWNERSKKVISFTNLGYWDELRPLIDNIDDAMLL